MTPTQIQQFKEQMDAGCAVGIFMKTVDGAIVECAGRSGMDFCILDMEHGPVSYEGLQDLIRACECSGALPIVRVAGITEEYIGKALDLGAAGVQIPQVNDKNAAARAVEYAKFYPGGSRGVCRYVRAAEYSSKDRYEYFRDANKASIVAQVEGLEGVRNLDEIFAVPGIDVVFIGPYDLSQSLGVTGDVLHPKVVEQMELIIQKAAAAGVTVGTFVDTVEDGVRWKNLGVKYIAVSVDVGVFYTACKGIVTGLTA